MSRSDCSFARISNGLRLAYVEQGGRGGPAIVMLHGYADSHRSFDLLRPHLPDAWRAVAMTARGHGRSDKPDDGYSVSEMAADVPVFLDALGIGRAILVGHSMGATTALQVAADYPDRVCGLVLMGAFATFRDKPMIEDLAAEVRRFEDPVDAEFVLAFQESAFAAPIPQAFLDTVIGESLRCPAHVWRGALQGQLDAAILDAAARCQSSALLLRGELDALAPHEDQLKVRAALASARLFTMPGVGHAPHWERPAATAAFIQAYVGELADSGAFLRHGVFG